jgi:hypothetical protein
MKCIERTERKPDIASDTDVEGQILPTVAMPIRTLEDWPRAHA